MTTRTLTRPILPTDVARAALAATRHDVLLHAGVSLMLLAGLRPGEIRNLQVKDWMPGEDPRMRVRSDRLERTIRIAPSAAGPLDAYLAGEEVEPDEPLLLGLKPAGVPHLLHRVFRDAMQQAGLDVSVHELRQAAIAEVLVDGTPVLHVEAYFGLSKAPGRKDLVAVSEGYDVGIAACLEAAFAA
ncbi:hypothetical protein [Streptomyces flavidovirens]